VQAENDLLAEGALQVLRSPNHKHNSQKTTSLFHEEQTYLGNSIKITLKYPGHVVALAHTSMISLSSFRMSCVAV
jgi:hypothetical protein